MALRILPNIKRWPSIFTWSWRRSIRRPRYSLTRQRQSKTRSKTWSRRRISPPKKRKNCCGASLWHSGRRVLLNFQPTSSSYRNITTRSSPPPMAIAGGIPAPCTQNEQSALAALLGALGKVRETKAIAATRLHSHRECLSSAFLLAIAASVCGSITAQSAPLRIVAIGASNTHGWYVGNRGAYPAQLQALLRAKGFDAEVTNAGVPFETTAMMLRRIDKDVPNGTDIAVLEPGGNDRRFFGTKEQRTANIAEMERRLRARSISVIVYDEEMPLRYRAFDFIHFTYEGQGMIAAALLPRVMEILDRRRNDVLPSRNASRR